VVLCKLAYDNNMPTARIMNSFMEKKYNYIGTERLDFAIVWLELLS